MLPGQDLGKSQCLGRQQKPTFCTEVFLQVMVVLKLFPGPKHY